MQNGHFRWNLKKKKSIHFPQLQSKAWTFVGNDGPERPFKGYSCFRRKKAGHELPGLYVVQEDNDVPVKIKWTQPPRQHLIV